MATTGNRRNGPDQTGQAQEKISASQIWNEEPWCSESEEAHRCNEAEPSSSDERKVISLKGMRAKFSNKSGKPRQRPMGRVVLLAAGSVIPSNRAWRIK